MSGGRGTDILHCFIIALHQAGTSFCCGSTDRLKGGPKLECNIMLNPIRNVDMQEDDGEQPAGVRSREGVVGFNMSFYSRLCL